MAKHPAIRGKQMTNKTKLAIALLSLTFITALSVSPSFSQDQAADLPESTDSSHIDPKAVKENIQERIKQAVSSTSPDSLGITDATILGWVGIIDSITNQTITLSTSGLSRLVAATDTTTIIADGVEADLEDLEINNPLIAIGTIDENDILNAKRLVTIDELPQKSTKHSLLASVDELDLDEATMSATPVSQSPAVALSITSDTTLTQGDDRQDLDLDQLQAGDQLLIIYQQDLADPTLNNAILLHLPLAKPALPEDEQ